MGDLSESAFWSHGRIGSWKCYCYALCWFLWFLWLRLVTVIRVGYCDRVWKSRRIEDVNVKKTRYFDFYNKSFVWRELARCTDHRFSRRIQDVAGTVGRCLLSLSHLHILLYCVITTRFLSSVGTRVFANGLPMCAYSFASVVLTGNTKSRLSHTKATSGPNYRL